MEQFIYVLAIVVLFLALVAIIGIIVLCVYVAKEYLCIDIKPTVVPKTPLKPIFKPKPKPTEEEIKYSKILANIDAYNGSGKGQTKV
jgi:hypothetical protein